jgi:hypothetical protein
MAIDLAKVRYIFYIRAVRENINKSWVELLSRMSGQGWEGDWDLEDTYEFPIGSFWIMCFTQTVRSQEEFSLEQEVGDLLEEFDIEVLNIESRDLF